jgi:hypothetical protein
VRTAAISAGVTGRLCARVQGDGTVVERINVADVESLAQSLPIWQRVRSVLTSGPRTLSSLSDELGVNIDSLDRTVRRQSALFTRVSGHSGISRIALLESRVA